MGTYLVLAVDGISASNTTGRSATGGVAVVAPAGALLAVGTISGHVSCVATDTANNAGSVILSLGAVVLAVTDLTAVLAGLVLVVSECTVESSELTKLVTLELVLSLGNRGGLFQG